jgi:SNF2 family DNA or RNA helicase
MGTGKTLQALAAMACYRDEWPLLIVVPASLRLVWAEVAEAWLPFLRPTDIKVRLIRSCTKFIHSVNAPRRMSRRRV